MAAAKRKKSNAKSTKKRIIRRKRPAKKSTGQSTISARKGKRSYSIKELSTKAHRTIRTFLPDLENHSKEIDALKAKGDAWGAEIYGHKTFNLYGTISQLAGKLGTYKGLTEEHPGKALKNIKIIHVANKDISKWFQDKKLEREEGIRLAKLKGKESRKRVRQTVRKLEQARKEIRRLKAQLKRKTATKKKPKKSKRK